MLIESASTGYRMEVSSEHRAMTDSVIEQKFLNLNEYKGAAYVWDFPGYNYDAEDTVMFLRNDSDTHLHIHHIYLYCDTATKLQVHIPASPTAAGTAVTGVNLNQTSGNVAEATAKQDETGNTQGTILHSEYIAANGEKTIFKEEGYEIILGKNDCIAVDLVTAGTMAYGHIVGYFHSD